MLPAWVVTDGDLIIRNWNDFTYNLLEEFGSPRLLGEQTLSVDLENLPHGNLKSFWECVLDPGDLGYIKAALKILKEHVAILKRFNEKDDPRSFEPLLDQLRKVRKYEGVVPLIYRPRGKMFRLGVKVSPPQGLKLIKKADIEGASVEYVDVVMAYRLKADRPSEHEVSQVFFCGVQPAIHDASERHQLWEKAKLEEHAQITQFLSHALKTPISNVKFMVRELGKAQLNDYYLGVCAKLESHVSDLGNLSDLILFINTSEKVPTILRGAAPRDAVVWEAVSLDEIREEIADTIRSIHRGRTRDPQDERRIELLSGETTRGAAIDYAKTAESILDVSALGDIDSFALLLHDSDYVDDNIETAMDLVKKVKTTFVNLLLVELLLNAIKYSDPHAPKVRVDFTLNERKDRLHINVINNGTELKESEFKNALKELASKPGEKRMALGLLLNMRAAEILDWELQWKRPEKKGTHLSLSIPFAE
jgi:signal transduction histidine kinase